MMNTEALLKGAKILENIRKERCVIDHGIKKFDMSFWHCGSAACAIGHFMYHPWFNKRGFKASQHAFSVVPTYEDLQEYNAISSFFGISCSAVSYLFGLHSWMRPKEVAARIRNFVKTGGKINDNRWKD